MKKVLSLIALVALFVAVPARSHAHSWDSDDSEHPLRIVAYILHPIGVALQDFIFRPIHRLVSSSPEASYWFGHEPTDKDQY